jgi:hypothetical protein
MLSGLSPVSASGNAELRLSGGGLPPEGWSKAINISANNRVTVVSPAEEGVQVVFGADGLFTVEFRHPVTNAITQARGALFQKQKLGAGFFLGPRDAGALSLRPAAK